MKSNKSKRIVIILIIITLLVLILSGVAYMYFATDLFRSNKQVFFEYASKILDDKKGFISNELLQYYNKIISTPYENKGELTCNVSTNTNQEEYENLNQMKISFDGTLDLKNKNFEENVNINYSPDVVFPLTIRKSSDIVGVQTQYIGSKYIAENVSDLQGEDSLSFNINDVIPNAELNQEQLKGNLDKYIEIINSRLSDDKFSKTENGYKLTLTYQELKDLAVVLLENLKNDEQMLNNINQITSNEITSNDIDNIILKLNDNTSNQDTNIEITLYVNNNELSQIEIKNSDNNNSIRIEKTESSESLKYTISLTSEEENNSNIVFTMEYKGLNSLQTIDETYTLETSFKESTTQNTETSYENNAELTDDGNEVNGEENIISTENTDIENNTTTEENTSLENENVQNNVTSNSAEVDDSQTNNDESNTLTYTYQLTNQVNFIESANIEGLTSENAIILSEYEQSQIDSLMNSITERITEVNREQMEELGITETENPLLKFIPSIFISNSANEAMENSISELEGIEISAFNAKFEPYQSTNSMGTTTRGLLTVIQTNNEEEGTQKIQEINFDGTEYEVTDQNIVFIKSSIEPESYYRIEFEKDSNTGIIYRVVINKK